MEFKQIKQTIDEICADRGLKDYKLVFSRGSELSASACGREITETAIGVSSVLTLTAVINEHGGSASTNLFDRENLERMVDMAIDNASHLEGTNKCRIFAGSPSYGKTSNPAYTEPAMKDIIAKTLEIQNQMLDADARVQSGSETQVGCESSVLFLANSKGLCLENRTGYTMYYQSAVVKDGDDVKLAYDYKVQDLDKIKLDKCVSEAISKLGALPTQTRQAPAVFSSDCMRQMLGAFIQVFFGRNAYLGLSLLKDREGQKIASECVNLIDDPFEPSGVAQIQFDADGVATYRKEIVKAGELKTLLYNLSSAEECGKQTTGNSGPFLGSAGTMVFSLYLDKGNCSKDELYARAGDGVYIQEMKGLHAGANPNSGDFSIECAGFEIVGGKLDHPIKSFTISGNFYDLLNKVKALSDEVEFSPPHGFSRFGAPEVLVESISIGA